MTPGESRSGPVEVAALQLRAAPGEPEANRRRYVEAVLGLERPVDLVVTPELSVSGYDLGMLAEAGPDLAETLSGPSVTMTRELARDASATIVLGLLERAGDLLYDTAVIVTPEGDVTPYRKTHLYPPEAKVFAAGDELGTTDTPAGRLGPLICFEHAFPAIALTLAGDGAQVLVIPSAVPDGFEHLLTLRSRARAQDNQVFVVACNQAGNGFCGRSLIAGPRGELLASAGAEETTIRAILDLDRIPAERVQEPALRLHRPGLYRMPVPDHDR